MTVLNPIIYGTISQVVTISPLAALPSLPLPLARARGEADRLGEVGRESKVSVKSISTVWSQKSPNTNFIHYCVRVRYIVLRSLEHGTRTNMVWNCRRNMHVNDENQMYY